MVLQLRSLLSQIRKWLQENPQLWRYLGCASAVVGLVCFALSSYSNILFRHWNSLKIVSYSVISVGGICVAVWSPKASREVSTNRRFQAHVEASAGIMGAIISFIIDKVNKKPDAYGPTSCAAFAVMSFSLSRRTDYGFEVEMQNFFLGTLIVQLARIKWWFCFAGAVFYFFLTKLRSFLEAPSVDDENVERQDERLVIQVDSLLSVPQPQQDNSVGDGTDEILEEFRFAMMQFEYHLKNEVMALEDYLEIYLKRKPGKYPWKLENDPNMLVDRIPSIVIEKLRKKLGRMIDVRLENQCSEEYSNMRRNMFRWQWKRYLEMTSSGDDKAREIQEWIKVSKLCMRVLFPNERRLCDRVFSGFSSIPPDISFKKVCSEMTSYILDFAKVWAERSSLQIALRKRLRVRVFKALDGLIPEFNSVFSDECCAPLRNEAITVRNALADAIRDYHFEELEDMIRHDTEQESVPGGIHPITVIVMNQLLDVFKATSGLEIFFRDYLVDAVRDGMFSPLSVRMARTIEVLEIRLQNRSKTYRNNALGYVFLMNNHRYIEQKAQNSRLGATLGDEWIQQQTAKVRQNLEFYQRSSWDKVLDILKLDNKEELNMTAESMIEKLGLFKTHFREIWDVQRSWFVKDQGLREEIRESLRSILLPAYKDFYSRLHNALGKDAYNIRIHTIFEIEDLLNRLFDGREN